jgi:hypothetical protein
MLGCAPAVEPVRVRAADLSSLAPALDIRDKPLIIEFDPGDALPVDLTLTGDLLELAPPVSPLELRARRRFFVRMSADGLAVSLDGVHFGARPIAPGSFRIGLAARPSGSRVTIDIKTPTHAPPGG